VPNPHTHTKSARSTGAAVLLSGLCCLRACAAFLGVFLLYRAVEHITEKTVLPMQDCGDCDGDVESEGTTDRTPTIGKGKKQAQFTTPQGGVQARLLTITPKNGSATTLPGSPSFSSNEACDEAYDADDNSSQCSSEDSSDKESVGRGYM
jgi:hypothetical protein